jgi:hypothetical protein
VYYCRGELDEGLARAARHLDTPDIALLMRLCGDANAGNLSHHTRCLSLCVSTRRGFRTVYARNLPFLHILLRAHGKDGENRKWLKGITSVKTMAEVQDTAVKRFLEEEKVMATR